MQGSRRGGWGRALRRLLPVAALWLAACAQAPTAAPAVTVPEGLLDDSAFAAPAEPVDVARLFELSPEMRAYLANDLAAALRQQSHPRALVDALYRRNALQLQYDASLTQRAELTFAARRGNCLSLVIMTAALAKALDLPVDYRAADIDDSFSRRGGLVVASGHVNITLGRRLLDHGRAGDANVYTVDFLPPAELQGLRSHRIDESELVAMYLNNRAAEALAAGRLDDAYAWAREAVLQRPAHATAYNTLGAVFRQRGLAPRAERAFRRALALAPRNLAAMANLAQLLAGQGRAEEAAQWERRLAALEPHPPFEEQEQGRRALARGDYAGARQWFTKALARSEGAADAHYWLGLALYYLDDWPAALAELRLAVQGSANRSEQTRYAAKLDWLREHARSAP